MLRRANHPPLSAAGSALIGRVRHLCVVRGGGLGVCQPPHGVPPRGASGSPSTAAGTGGAEGLVALAARRWCASAAAASASAADQELLERLRPLLEVLIPRDKYITVSETYAALPSADRSAIRKSSYKQLGRLLAAIPSEFDVTHDKLMVRCTAPTPNISVLADAAEAPPADATAAPKLTTPPKAAMATPKLKIVAPPAKPADDGKPKRKAVLNATAARITNSKKTKKGGGDVPSAPVLIGGAGAQPVEVDDAPRGATGTSNAADTFAMPEVMLNQAPPPPPDIGLSPSSRVTALSPAEHAARYPNAAPGSADGPDAPGAMPALAAEMLAGYMPPWFVPVEEVVSRLPEGYTLDHIEHLFGTTSTVQLVTVLGAKFCRFLGAHRNKRAVDLDVDESAVEVRTELAKFRPDPRMLAPFLPKLEPRGEWRSRFSFVTATDQAHSACLPFHGPQSLLFFAQMQHVIAFSAADGGGLCVPMKAPSTLGWEETPVVIACHSAWRLLEGNPTQLDQLWAVLPEAARDELEAFYGEASVHASMSSHVGLSQERGWKGATADADAALPKKAEFVAPLPPPMEDAFGGIAEPQRNGMGGPPPPEAHRGWGAVPGGASGEQHPTAGHGGEDVPLQQPQETERGSGEGATRLEDETRAAADAPAEDGAIAAGDGEGDAAAVHNTNAAVEEAAPAAATGMVELTPEEQAEEAELLRMAEEELARADAEAEAEATASTNAAPTAAAGDDDYGMDEEDAGAAAASLPQQDDRPDTPVEATLRRFIESHSLLFALRPNSRLALLAFEVRAYERQNMSLEEQLNLALELRNNTLVKKIKRKMAVLAAPDNPLLVEANLAQAVADFLPPDRGLPFRKLKDVLPSDVMDLIPIKRGKKFFDAYPQLFKVYEVHHAGRRIIQRGHLPAPDGCLRGEGDFTEPEMLAIVGGELAYRPRSASAIAQRLPLGVERTLTNQFGGPAQFCMAYPQYFAVIMKDSKKKDYRTAMITLVSMPPPPGHLDSQGRVPLRADGEEQEPEDPNDTAAAAQRGGFPGEEAEEADPEALASNRFVQAARASASEGTDRSGSESGGGETGDGDGDDGFFGAAAPGDKDMFPADDYSIGVGPAARGRDVDGGFGSGSDESRADVPHDARGWSD